jgi:hypothetical protein
LILGPAVRGSSKSAHLRRQIERFIISGGKHYPVIRRSIDRTGRKKRSPIKAKPEKSGDAKPRVLNLGIAGLPKR